MAGAEGTAAVYTENNIYPPEEEAPPVPPPFFNHIIMKSSYHYLNILGWIIAGLTTVLGCIGITSIASANGVQLPYIGLIALFFYAFLEIGKRILFKDLGKAISTNQKSISIMLALFTIIITALLIYFSFEGAKKAFYSSDIWQTVTAHNLLEQQMDSLISSIDNSLTHIDSKIENYVSIQDAYKEKTGFTVTQHHQSDIAQLRKEKLRLYDEKQIIRNDYKERIATSSSSKDRAGGKLAYISLLLESLLIAILAYLSYYRHHATTTSSSKEVKEAEAPKEPQLKKIFTGAKLEAYRDDQNQLAAVAQSQKIGFEMVQNGGGRNGESAPPIIATITSRSATTATTSSSKTGDNGGEILTLRRAKSDLSKYKGRSQTATVKARIKYNSHLINLMEKQGIKQMLKPVFVLAHWQGG